MVFSKNNHFIFVLFSIFVILKTSSSFENHSSTNGLLPFAPKHVVIINELNSQATMLLRCKNKRKDLGLQVLHVEESFAFSFRVNLRKTTRYICTFNWPEHQATFAIFKVDRDDSPKSKIGLCRVCIWKIYELGPCRAKSNGTSLDCFDWDSISL